MNKAYSRINFQNAPSTATPLNATNLNKMDKAINDLDDRIIELSGYQEEAQEAAEQASSSASAAAKAAETATADAEARVNAIIEGLEVYTKEESDKKFASVIKQVATGSPILIKDGTDAGALDFRGKGRSTQNGTPTPDNPIAIKSVADSGYFDGELLRGFYDAMGKFVSNASYVCSKNPIPCNGDDTVKVIYVTISSELTLIFYDKDMNFISRLYDVNVTEHEEIAPTNAKYVHFYLREPNAFITPTTAKPITVTINGKYALIVKSKGKNLLKNTIIEQTTNGITFNKNDDESFSISGTATQNNSYAIGTVTLPKGTYVLSGCTKGSNATYFVYISSPYLEVTNAEKSFTLAQETTLTILIRYISGATINDTIYPMIRPIGTDDTYEPYKETVTYIPLNEPLRSLGNVKDEVNLDEGNITRRFKEVIFDGSDELWLDYGQQASGLYRYNIGVADLKKQRMGAICTHFTPSNAYQFSEIKEVCFSTHPTSPELAFFTEYATLTEFKTWLQANPITVQYELAEPITETIEPVDIVTYDNVTYISNADNAEMEVTYATDTKSYIDSKFAELHAALVNML